MTTATAHELRSYINVGQENSTPIDLYYEDHGSAKPVVLIHGFPLNGASWEKQTRALLAAGHRVITYDRRGFGRSSQPTIGYNYDTFTEDLNKLLTELDLRDVALAGFSMGGGEVARYLGTYGSERIRKAVFISPIVPLVVKTADNPAGVDAKVFEGIAAAVDADRPAFLTAFLRDFYNLDLLGGKLISDQAVQNSWNVAIAASATGTHDCVATWTTDFREDVARVDVPTLIIQGDADRILPIAATGLALSKAVKGSRMVTIEGGPHGILWTHGDKVSAELVKFLA
jgi:non-heme chloroperoxidase